MKNKYISIICCFLVLGTGIREISAQLSSWSYKTRVEIWNKSNKARTNYAELVLINTQSLVSAGMMKVGGDDIRFADSCSNSANILQHYLFADMNTDSTKIWVKVPSIPAGGKVTLYMFYGNSAANSTSSLANTFGTVFKTGGPNYTLGDTQTYDYFEIESNDTIFVSPGKTLTIQARCLVINGAIVGSYRGNIPSTLSSKGGGSGGGGTSTNAGSGGGGYGGDGGTGGYDSGDTPGGGGAAYGTSSGLDIEMGSAGGSSDLVSGGKSGTAINLIADFLVKSGNIHNDGSDGIGLQARNGGGGSGGGVMLRARNLKLGGKISAIGGNGGVGTSTANDDGGGGGGGRIKIFWSAYLSGSVSYALGGGTGGPNGTASGGINGGTGTFHKAQRYMVFDSVVTGSFNMSLSDPDHIICEGVPLTATASSGFSNYSFYLNTSLKQSGSSASYTYKGLKDKDSLSVRSSQGGCYAAVYSVKVTVVGKPVVKITCPDTALCLGDSVSLTASGANGFQWVGGPKTDVWKLLPTASKTFTVYGTSNNNCMDTATQYVTVNTYPANVSISGRTYACSGDTVVLRASGASNYVWNTGGTKDTISPKILADKKYTVEGYNHPDCRIQASHDISVIPLPNVYISGKTHICPGETVTLGANGADQYTWGNGSHALSESYKPAVKTTYTLTGKDAFGCSNSTSKTVDIDTIPKIRISGDNELCPGESTTLTAAGGNSYKWHNNTSKTTLKLTPSLGKTQVFVVGTDNNNCSDTAKMTVEVFPNPKATLSFAGTGLDTVCLNDAPWALSGGLPSGGFYRGFAVTAGKFNPSVGTGKYGVEYVYADAHGCRDSAQSSIIVDICLGTQLLTSREGIRVFPNPAVNQVRVQFEREFTWNLLHMNGQELRHSDVFAHEAVIELNELPAGLYLLQIRTAEGIFQSVKLIVEN